MLKSMNCYPISLIWISKTVKTLIYHFHEKYWCIQTSKYMQSIFINTIRVTEIHSNSFSQHGNEKCYCQRTTNIKRKRGNEKREKDKKITKIRTSNHVFHGMRHRGTLLSMGEADTGVLTHAEAALWKTACRCSGWSEELSDDIFHTQRTTAAAFEEAVLG